MSDKRGDRLRKDFMEILKSTDNIIINEYEPSNMSSFSAVVTGPPNTPYEGGMFVVGVDVPREWPMKPPKIGFETNVWHPNVSKWGRICVDFLADSWTPGITLIEALEGIQGLLAQPNELSPLNHDAAQMFIRDLELYEKTVRMWTKVYAGGQASVPDLEESLGVVTALGMSEKQALRRLTLAKWVLKTVVDSMPIT